MPQLHIVGWIGRIIAGAIEREGYPRQPWLTAIDQAIVVGIKPELVAQRIGTVEAKVQGEIFLGIWRHGVIIRRFTQWLVIAQPQEGRERFGVDLLAIVVVVQIQVRVIFIDGGGR